MLKSLGNEAYVNHVTCVPFIHRRSFDQYLLISSNLPLFYLTQAVFVSNNIRSYVLLFATSCCLILVLELD